jgi:hypothetical protein
MKSRAFRVGTAIGGLMGILIAFGMDHLSGDVPGGGWVGAVAHDMNMQPSSPWAFILAVLAVVIMVIVSAGLGGLCGLALEHFFKMFTQE